jgi:hypothetical protein
MLTEIKAWKCEKCQRIYFDKPAACSCVAEISQGNLIGCFKVINRNNGRKLTVTCLLCGLDTEVDSSNIRRQKSCGCKPKHIDILSNTEQEVRYRCKKCTKTHVEGLPAMEWCCEEGIEQ